MREIRYHVSPFKFITYVLVTNKKELRHVLKENGIPKGDVQVKKRGARVSFVNFVEGDLAIIQLPDSDHTLCEKVGLLAHECVHIKQFVMKSIGEDKPSDEFEAYFVQDIVTDLVEDYFESQEDKQ